MHALRLAIAIAFERTTAAIPRNKNIERIGTADVCRIGLEATELEHAHA